MPHIVIKLFPGRSEEQKTQLTAQIVKKVTSTLNCGDDSVSIAFEEIPSNDWSAKVYQPEILPNLEKLYKKPGYTM